MTVKIFIGEYKAEDTANYRRRGYADPTIVGYVKKDGKLLTFDYYYQAVDWIQLHKKEYPNQTLGVEDVSIFGDRTC